MASQRVVIVGGGVLGLFTAYELLLAGEVDVTVIDAAHPGDGSSGRSVGMVETQYLSQPDIEVRAYGREVYARLEHDHDLEFVHGGYLRLGRGEHDVSAFEQSVQWQHELGIKDCDVLTAGDISRRWPQIVTDDLDAGLFGEWDGYVDGFQVCQLLVKLIRTAGGRVVPRSPLQRADRVGDEWRLGTSTGDLVADVVVNAAGPWAAVVGDLLGAPVELIPQLHGAVMIELGGPRPLTPFVMDYVPGSGVDGVYFRSERPDQLVAGLHTDEIIRDVVSPDVPLGPVSFEFLERVTALLARRLIGTDNMAVGRSWTGIYPMSHHDHRPVAGRHATTGGVVCALGAGGTGIQLSPAAGRLAADAVLNRPSAFTDRVDWRHGRE